MKNDMTRNCQSLFLFKSKLQLTFFKNFSSWSETVIADVYNTCNRDTDIIWHAKIAHYRNLQKNEHTV